MQISRIALAVFVCFAFTLSVHAQYKQTTPPSEKIAKGFKSITEADSTATLRKLVAFSGRGTGQEGYVKAAHFVAGKLAEYGFDPLGKDGTYFQGLPFARVSPNLETSTLKIGDALMKPTDGGIGFTSFNKSTALKGKIAFVSVKGDRAQFEEGTDLRDKVIVLNSERTSFSFLRRLARMSPATIVQVVDGEVQNRSRVTGARGGRGGALRIQVSRDVAKKMAEACSVDAAIVSKEKADGTVLKLSEKELEIDFKLLEQPMKVPNVVGWLEGSDPELKDEYIVIGAHLDHLGERDGKLFPGADDNGSGSTALLQIAKALSLNPVKPKRSVLYIAFAAEEIGLVGSKYYCDNPLKPLEKCACMLNIDMIGRNEEKNDEKASENETSIHLVGAKSRSQDLYETVVEANKRVGFDFEFDEERTVFRRSDQASFADKGIAVAFLFGGFNPYYHQTTDSMNGINPTKIANAARLYYTILYLSDDHPAKYALNK